jgi:hypothetical protein
MRDLPGTGCPPPPSFFLTACVVAIVLGVVAP